MLEGVKLCALQGINHLSDHDERTRELKAWTGRRTALNGQLSWFEATAAASAFLPHPLLAFAAESGRQTSEATKVSTAYFPWMALTITMLDSYTDLIEDRVSGSHSYVSYYDTRGIACERLCEIIQTLLQEMARLPRSHRHIVMAASMIAMYLSSGDCREPPQILRMTNRIAASGGSFTRLLVPAANVWGMIHGGQLKRSM